MFKGTEEIEGTVTGLAVFLVPSLGLELFCKSGTISGYIEAGNHGKQTINLSECALKGAEESCLVDSIQAVFLTKLLLHAGATWVKFTPPGSGPFTVIKLLGEECPFAAEHELTGAFMSKVSEAESVAQSFSFLSDEATILLFKTGYYFGTEPALLLISTSLELSGENAGEKWGAQ